MLKTILKKTAPAQIVGRGRRAGFALVERGETQKTKLRGITKRLKRIHSRGVLPMIARRAAPRPGGHWRGKNGGRRRGKAVDAQLARIVNRPSALKEQSHVYTLTKNIIAALATASLEPVMAQRAVASEKHGLATAVDVVCVREKKLVLVEIKCGYDHGRKAAALGADARELNMRGPLEGAKDSTLHRHFAQLAATLALFKRERKTIKMLKEKGVDEIGGALLYASDEGCELFTLPSWWMRRSTKLLDALR